MLGKNIEGFFDIANETVFYCNQVTVSLNTQSAGINTIFPLGFIWKSK